MVLAGGRSRRMGRPKESLPIGGSTLLGLAVERLLLTTHPVIVLARDGEQDLPPLPIECEIAYDSDAGAGPMKALRDALRLHEGQADAVLVIGCDYPFLDERAIGWLAGELGDHDCVVPKALGRLQPLCAIYRTRLRTRVEALVRDGVDTIRTVAEEPRARILDEDRLRAFDPELRFLRNVNDPASYEAAVRELGQ
ncbi:MAG: molybdenum cofactor guanylyltransferase [Planctomycetota bacterium]